MAKAKVPIKVGDFIFVTKDDDNNGKSGTVEETRGDLYLVRVYGSSAIYEYTVDDLEFDGLPF